MARMGMDVERVEAAANALKTQATHLETLIRNIDKIVKSTLTNWEGADAAKFVNQAWPSYLTGLRAALEHIQGLIQSMQKNIDEQRTGSERNGGGTTTPAQPHATLPAPQQQTHVASVLGSTEVGTASPPPSQDAYNSRHESVGLFAQGGGSNGQCTSWVHFRRTELGLPAPTLWNGAVTQFNTSPPTLAESNTPSIGAVGSFYGHTFVVEGITKPDFPREITISEMNVGAWVDKPNSITTGWDKVTTDTYSEVSPGVWKSGKSGIHTGVTFGQ